MNLLTVTILLLGSWGLATGALETKTTATYAATAPVVDGSPDDPVWVQAQWYELAYPMAGTMPEPNDFSGRYKIVWTEHHIFVLAEITDDIIIDSHPDPLVSYWNDDTFEVFVDEDASGGNHLDNDNAYAYHMALDNQVVDIGPDGKPQLLPSHVKSAWKRKEEEPYHVYWEARISVFPPGSTEPRTLTKGEVLGFMVAYCDADSAAGREHFMGDVEVEAVNGDRNLGYIDASVFGKLKLEK